MKQIGSFFTTALARWRSFWPWKMPTDPATRMFRDIQGRLILWYSGVLAVILIVAGTLLYTGMQHQLLGPVDSYLAKSTDDMSLEWQTYGILPCLERFSHTPYTACYDANGNLLAASHPAIDSPGFLTTPLVKSAIAGTPGKDTVNAENGLGAVSRYAVAVHDPKDGHTLGIVQVGLSVEGETRALTTLRNLLLVLGLLTLGGASIGGFILAHRALVPAHLAYTRQQAFIADASHELRTPLTLLRTDAEVLLRGRSRLAPEDAALLDDIVAESGYLAILTTNLLTLARLDSSTASIAQDVIDLTDITTTVVRRTSALATEKQVSVRNEGKLTPILVIGDQQLLEQAVLILVDNAIKYNVADGEVTIQTYSQGNQGIIEVRDTGLGIAADHLELLGERFYRPDRARSRETGGTGLGLSIAFGIARAHHGTLTLTSKVRLGTTALLSLPIASLPDE